MLDGARLKILTESARYDVSCSSSGVSRKNTACGLGNTQISGICHSFTEDGRCISLLKILLSNDCVYDCEYCINRRTNDIPRASATPTEICELTVNFYKRNFIEGLFLSSAVINSPDYTMELLFDTVVKLRKNYGFNGYIHLKGIPGADYLTTARVASYVDRISYNIELPTEKSLKLLAPQKNKNSIITPMRTLSQDCLQQKAQGIKNFLPAGQTTQMIIGASPETDGHIIKLSEALYKNYKLKRVYYSSYLPTNPTSKLLPSKPTGLLREHRLYQADWLMRFYGFSANEIISDEENLPMEYDPKCAWALRNMHLFPIEINTAPPELLVRIPGIGFKSAYKIVHARKHTKLRLEHLKKMRIVLKRTVHFITVNGKFYGHDNLASVTALLSAIDNENQFEQLNFFSSPEITQSVLFGDV